MLDVTDEAAASSLIDRIGPWALVHNAGYMNAGLLEDVPVDDARRQYEVMLFAPVRLVQLALPGMRRRGGGRIVFVSSSIGQMTVPFQGWYGAVKRSLSAGRHAADRGRGRRHRRRAGRARQHRHPLWDDAEAELAAHRAHTREPSANDRAIEAMETAAGTAPTPATSPTWSGGAARGAPAVPPPGGARVGRSCWRAGWCPPAVRDRVTRAVGGL